MLYALFFGRIDMFLLKRRILLSMKKRILSVILLSTVVLSSTTPATVVLADNYSAKIAAKDAAIKNLTAEQSAARSKVAAVQAQVNELQAKQEALKLENDKLEAESKALSKEIEVLSSNIVARTAALKKQARSAQQNNVSTSYINVLLNSESVSDAVSRVIAVGEVVSANESMLRQQEADKVAIAKKQKANQEAINTVWKNQDELAATEASLSTQKAQLEVAQLNLASQLATVEGEKNALLSQKAAAEQAAAAAAAAEAARKAEVAKLAETQAKSVADGKAVVTAAAATAATVTSPSTGTTAAPATTAVTAASSSANNYPVGECTWGVKQLAGWAGGNWGNANQWPAAAAAAGFRTGSVPAVGAIVSWSGGGTGHVAVVTGVDGDKIQVQESNYAGNRYISNFRGWFNPVGIQGAVTYIYPN